MFSLSAWSNDSDQDWVLRGAVDAAFSERIVYFTQEGPLSAALNLINQYMFREEHPLAIHVRDQADNCQMTPEMGSYLKHVWQPFGEDVLRLLKAWNFVPIQLIPDETGDAPRIPVVPLLGDYETHVFTHKRYNRMKLRCKSLVLNAYDDSVYYHIKKLPIPALGANGRIQQGVYLPNSDLAGIMRRNDELKFRIAVRDEAERGRARPLRITQSNAKTDSNLDPVYAPNVNANLRAIADLHGGAGTGATIQRAPPTYLPKMFAPRTGLDQSKAAQKAIDASVAIVKASNLAQASGTSFHEALEELHRSGVMPDFEVPTGQEYVAPTLPEIPLGIPEQESALDRQFCAAVGVPYDMAQPSVGTGRLDFASAELMVQVFNSTMEHVASDLSDVMTVSYRAIYGIFDEEVRGISDMIYDASREEGATELEAETIAASATAAFLTDPGPMLPPSILTEDEPFSTMNKRRVSELEGEGEETEEDTRLPLPKRRKLDFKVPTARETKIVVQFTPLISLNTVQSMAAAGYLDDKRELQLAISAAGLPSAWGCDKEVTEFTKRKEEMMETMQEQAGGSNGAASGTKTVKGRQVAATTRAQASLTAR